MTAVYILLALALAVVCAVLGLGVGLSWGSKCPGGGRVRALDSLLSIFGDTAIGFGIVSTGNPGGDKYWGWTGESKSGRWLHANRAMAALLGTSGELHNLTVADVIVPPPDLDAIPDGELREVVERVYQYRDQRPVPTDHTLTVVRDADGVAVFAVLMAVNRGKASACAARLREQVADLQRDNETLAACAERWKRASNTGFQGTIDRALEATDTIDIAVEEGG